MGTIMTGLMAVAEEHFQINVFGKGRVHVLYPPFSGTGESGILDSPPSCAVISWTRICFLFPPSLKNKQFNFFPLVLVYSKIDFRMSISYLGTWILEFDLYVMRHVYNICAFLKWAWCQADFF
ncbi:ER lumen protein retaining receptor 2 [Platysternon megacephalum]|uniref:ER lumen protein retaining receptor 2 n=1 Tax=Platysternon megacephalum TaxID=55544 RepID=A0A4D9DZ15_9SAUR|nr:ER lumen protein retaining receptor 2 [Platysternon megacephalum]